MIAKAISALTLAMVLSASAAALAQTPPPPPGDAAPMGPMDAHDRGPGAMREHRAMHEEARLKALHAALNIRPDQEAAFSAFADSMKPGDPGEGPKPDEMMREHQAMSGMTTPERLDMMARRMDEHIGRMRARFQAHSAAIKGLYAALTPDQRHTFDALPGLMGHMGMEPHGGGMGPGMGMGHMDEGE